MQNFIAFLGRAPYTFPVLAAFFWATNYVLGKIAVGTLPPFHLSAIRWLIAALILLPIVYQDMRKHRRLLLKNWKTVVFLGAAGVAGFNSILYLGMQYTTSINASLINSLQPAVIAILSVLLLREQIRKIQIVGFLISLFGFTVIFFRGKLEYLLSLTFNPGDMIIVATVFIWAIYSVMLIKRGQALPKKALFGATVLVGNLIMIPVALIEEQFRPFPWHLVSWELALLVLYLGIFPTIAAFTCWNESLSRLGVVKSSNFLHLIAMFAALFAVALGETLSWHHVVGGLLIISGIVLSTNPKILAFLENKHRSLSQ